MTPRPFYRSRAFWFGLLGLVFLLWGWWMSLVHQSAAGFPGNGFIGQMGGEVFACSDSGGGPMWGNFSSMHREMTEAEVRELKNWWAAETETAPSVRLVFIPYYWPVLAYTATWLLTLALWQRRKSHLMKLHAAPPP